MEYATIVVNAMNMPYSFPEHARLCPHRGEGHSRQPGLHAGAEDTPAAYSGGGEDVIWLGVGMLRRWEVWRVVMPWSCGWREETHWG